MLMSCDGRPSVTASRAMGRPSRPRKVAFLGGAADVLAAEVNLAWLWQQASPLQHQHPAAAPEFIELLRLDAHGFGAVQAVMEREVRAVHHTEKAPQPQVRRSVADHELRTLQAFAVIHLGAHQVLQAERIDDQRHAVALHRQVILLLLLVETETVLEANSRRR
jgi:hypothetical protein